MTMPQVTLYHAHVYFDASTRDQAVTLCERAASEMGTGMGRVHEKLVGPHPCWSCQLTFSAERLGEVLPWLNFHRDGLTVFIHPVTGNELDDHTRYVMWLGESKTLDVSQFL